MILSEFNQPANQKIAKMNKILQEQFGVTVKTNFPSKKKLEKVLETANMAVVKLRTSNKKFQLDAEYAKFLGIKDIVETMLSEGMYAESPSYRAMKKEMTEKVRDLMDKGYSDEEACAECMNQYRLDSRYAFDDDHVKGLVLLAAKEFMEQCMNEDADPDEIPFSDDLDPIAQRNADERYGPLDPEHELTDEGIDSPVPYGTKIVRDVARRYRLSNIYTNKLLNGGRTVKMYSTGNEHLDRGLMDDITVALEQAGVTGFSVRKNRQTHNDTRRKPRESIIVTLQPEPVMDEMIQEDDDDAQFFPGSTLIRAQSGLVVAEVFADEAGNWFSYDHFSDRVFSAESEEDAVEGAIEGGVRYSGEPVVNPFTQELSYPEDEPVLPEGHVNLGHLLQEEVDVEQAEVVMAVRALADDMQDQVERLGRMINEEVPAIADQIRGEMGATESQAFYDQMSQIINAQLESTRNAKAEMDAVVAQLSGEAPAAPDMTAPDMSTNSVASAPVQEPAPDAEADAMDINEPVAAGPEAAPLGRAKV